MNLSHMHAHTHAQTHQCTHTQTRARARARSNDGWTALHCAASEGFGDVIERLIKFGADVNAKTPKGRTPIIQAAWNARVDALEALLKHGGDPAVVDQVRLWQHATAGRGRGAVLLAVLLVVPGHEGYDQVRFWQRVTV